MTVKKTKGSPKRADKGPVASLPIPAATEVRGGQGTPVLEFAMENEPNNSRPTLLKAPRA